MPIFKPRIKRTWRYCVTFIYVLSPNLRPKLQSNVLGILSQMEIKLTNNNNFVQFHRLIYYDRILHYLLYNYFFSRTWKEGEVKQVSWALLGLEEEMVVLQEFSSEDQASKPLVIVWYELSFIQRKWFLFRLVHVECLKLTLILFSVYSFSKW